MNMDWAIAEALKNTNMGDITSAMLIYDIMCQYHIKLPERVAKNPRLTFPPVKLEKAIGLFHVHGHQDECYYRFASSFIPGAGIVDGEVLETLWSVLNNISRSTRTATLAHRAEVLDDHMNDSNWKKLIGIVSSVSRKFQRAIMKLDAKKAYHEDLTTAADDGALIAVWRREIEQAEADRINNVKAMDIIAPRIDKGEYSWL